MTADFSTALKKQAAFFRKGLLVDSSYKAGFLLRLLSGLVPLAFFYFLAKLVDPGDPRLAHYRGDYFAFAAIGVALTQYFARASSSSLRGLRNAQLSGVLEASLSTRTSPVSVILYEAVYNYTFGLLHLLVVLGASVAVFGLDLSRANWLVTLGGLVLTIVALVALTILASGVVIWLKSSEMGNVLVGGLTAFLAGAYFPVSVLPVPLQWLSELLPMKHALDVLRSSLLTGAGLTEIVAPGLWLLALTVALSVGGGGFFSWTVRQARKQGTLTQY